VCVDDHAHASLASAMIKHSLMRRQGHHGGRTGGSSE